MARGENFDNAVRQLCSIVKLDGILCVAEGKLGNLLFYNEAYRSIDSALMSMPSLQCLATTMVTRKTIFVYCDLLYKHFYQLVVFQLTLPVTSASRERAHSKVDIVKSAVKSSMTSERLEDFILISSEQTVLDSIELAVIVARQVCSNSQGTAFTTVVIIKLSEPFKGTWDCGYINTRTELRLTLLILVTW